MAPDRLTTIGFDADDTLWQNERFFRMTQARFADLLRDFADPDHLADRLLEAERRNLGHYGFGVKGFVLSMIETALDVTEDRVPGHVISALLAEGRAMLAHPIELLPQVRSTIEALSDGYRILLITKGDLLDQERKLAQSGLGDLFAGVEVVSDKTPQVYVDIFNRMGDGPEAAMMVGNSMKSDVLPALDAGSWGVHVPHPLTWQLEDADTPDGHARYLQIDNLGMLPELLVSIR